MLQPSSQSNHFPLPVPNKTKRKRIFNEKTGHLLHEQHNGKHGSGWYNRNEHDGRIINEASHVAIRNGLNTVSNNIAPNNNNQEEQAHLDHHKNSTMEQPPCALVSYFSLDSICESFNIPMNVIGRFLRSEEVKTIISCNLQTHRLKILWMALLNLMSRLYITVSTVQENSGNPITSSTLRMYPTPTANVYISPCIALVKCMAKQLYRQIIEITHEIESIMERLTEFNKLLSNFSETNHFLISQLVRYCVALEGAGSSNNTTTRQSSHNMKTTLIKEREFVSHFQKILIKRLGLILNGLDLSRLSQQKTTPHSKRSFIMQIDNLQAEDLFDLTASIQDVALKYGIATKMTTNLEKPSDLKQTTTEASMCKLKNNERVTDLTTNHNKPTTTTEGDDNHRTTPSDGMSKSRTTITNTDGELKKSANDDYRKNDHEMDLSGDSFNKVDEETNEKHDDIYAAKKTDNAKSHNLVYSDDDEKHHENNNSGESIHQRFPPFGDIEQHEPMISSSPPLCTPSTPLNTNRPLITSDDLSATPIPKSSQMIRATTSSSKASDDIDLSETGDLLPEDTLLLLKNSNNTPVLSAKKSKTKDASLPSTTKQASTQQVSNGATRNQATKRKSAPPTSFSNGDDSEEDDVPLVSMISSKAITQKHVGKTPQQLVKSNNKSKSPQQHDEKHDLGHLNDDGDDEDSFNNDHSNENQNDDLFDDHNDFDQP
ncbi:hypothetical protein C9374_001496 [Naegleria lovaniensis]|uniref:Uncharacterized protein n=1 Tax=Naegleria lovaniensis TaxID=51637 RepID=A0AA88GW04_NAELO|nr:uncharacterized protein C9374_001496 [Naegleria lovaniensis]KAG2387164.1 hypothetical protein C9374_001496 [Naegleria lovaniensis]